MTEGIFTPWAEILCTECNNDLVGEVQAARHVPMQDVPGEANAVCDRCGRDVHCLYEDAATCQSFARIAGFDLWQTGGMCVAAGFHCMGGEILVTVDEESEGQMMVGCYRGPDGSMGDADRLEVLPFAAAIALARQWRRELEAQ